MAWTSAVRRRLRDPRPWALVDQTIVSGCNFLTTVVAARNMTGEGFGIFSLAIAATLFLSNIHRATFTQPLNVLAASEPADRQMARLSALLRAHVLLVALSALLLAVIAIAFFPQPGLAVPALLYFACFALQETLRRHWYTTNAIVRASFNDFIACGGQLAAVIAIASLGHLTPATAFAAMALSSLAAFGVGMFSLRGHPRGPAISLRELAREHWPIAKWLVLTVLAIWGAGQAYPLLMVPLGAAAIAAYSASRNLLNALSLVVQSLGNYIPSVAVSTLRTEGLSALRRRVAITTSVATLGSVIFVALSFVFALPLLDFFYGGRYNHAAGDFGILAIGAASSLLGAIFGAYALALGDSRSSFFANLGATFVTFAVGPWLIAEQGTRGAAIAASLSLFTAMVLQFVQLAYRLGKGPLRN